MLLKGKNVVITGCNRGIGRAILDTFINEGANVWACMRSQNVEFEEELAALAEKNNVWIKPVYFELADEDSIKAGIKKIIGDKQPIDVLVNNAGMPHSGLLLMTPMRDLRKVYDVNLIAPLLMIQLISKVMIRQGGGNIINIASIGGIETREGFLAYGSSKAALIWATKSVSKELAHHNIRVNGIAPGLIETRMGIDIHTPTQIEETVELASMKRLGRPEEISNVALFLASDMSSFITGQIISADGGR